MSNNKVRDKVLKTFGTRRQTAKIANVTEPTIDYWKRYGVPVKYWHLWLKAGVTLEELYQACKR